MINSSALLYICTWVGKERCKCYPQTHTTINLWSPSSLNWVFNLAWKPFCISTVKSPLLNSKYSIKNYHLFPEISAHLFTFNRWPCPLFHKENGNHKKEVPHSPPTSFSNPPASAPSFPLLRKKRPLFLCHIHLIVFLPCALRTCSVQVLTCLAAPFVHTPSPQYLQFPIFRKWNRIFQCPHAFSLPAKLSLPYHSLSHFEVTHSLTSTHNIWLLSVLSSETFYWGHL